jgi:hypothetical protein
MRLADNFPLPVDMYSEIKCCLNMPFAGRLAQFSITLYLGTYGSFGQPFDGK